MRLRAITGEAGGAAATRPPASPRPPCSSPWGQEQILQKPNAVQQLVERRLALCDGPVADVARTVPQHEGNLGRTVDSLQLSTQGVDNSAYNV